MRDLHPSGAGGGRCGGISSTSICTQTAPPPSLPQEVAGKWQLCVCCCVSCCFEMSILIRFGFIFWGLQASLDPANHVVRESFRSTFFLVFSKLNLSTEVVTAVESLIPIPPPKHLCLLVWIFFSWARGHRKSNSLIHQQGSTFSTSNANSLSVKSSQEDLGSFVAWEWLLGILLYMCIWILNIFLHMTVSVLQTTWASELVKKSILRCGRRGGKGEDVTEWDLCVGVGLICRVRVVGLFLSGNSSLRISPCWKPAS